MDRRIDGKRVSTASPEIPIRHRQIPYKIGGLEHPGLPGFVLSDGTILPEEARDAYGNYWGSGSCYLPVRAADGTVTAFRRLDEPENYLCGAELSMEQNYDMIDGVIDNLPPERPERDERERKKVPHKEPPVLEKKRHNYEPER